MARAYLTKDVKIALVTPSPHHSSGLQPRELVIQEIEDSRLRKRVVGLVESAGTFSLPLPWREERDSKGEELSSKDWHHGSNNWN